MYVTKAEEEGFNEGFIFILLFFHTREGTGGKDAIHCVLIGLHVTKLSFDSMVFLSVGDGIVIGLIQDFITFGYGYG